MEEVTIIGIDLAKRSFQLHGAAADGSVVYRRKLSRRMYKYGNHLTPASPRPAGQVAVLVPLFRLTSSGSWASGSPF